MNHSHQTWHSSTATSLDSGSLGTEMGWKNPEFKEKMGLAAPRLGCSPGIRATLSRRAHCSIPMWLLDAEEAKRQPQTLGRQNAGALIKSPAQGHRESHQDEGDVGLTPEQHCGLWNQLRLGAHTFLVLKGGGLRKHTRSI